LADGTAPTTGTATVLFTDMVGSTARRAEIGEEAADRLRQAHDEVVGAAVADHRGIIVKHTGDGAMATFTAAVDAVGAAVALQQGIDRLDRSGDVGAVAVRIGISVGDVTFEGDDCFGLPVVEAQRLEGAGEAGSILCADLVRLLARGRGGHEFEPIGDLDLKGLPEPVPAARVRWEPVDEEAVEALDAPLPPLLDVAAGFALAGREAELAALQDAWSTVAGGQRRIVLLSGEPGVGKTRLAIELARQAREDGALVLAGRSDEDVAAPFQPWSQALRFHLGLLGERDPRPWLGPTPAELARVVPELADLVPGLDPPLATDPETERLRAFEALAGWLSASAAQAPVVLVLDDLHWADRSTLGALAHLAREPADVPMLVVGTYRDTDLDRTHPLAGVLADLRRIDGVQRVDVTGLDVDGVAALLAGAAGHDLDDAGRALAQAIHAESAGNPFFVGEVIRHLVESGALVHRDGRWESDLTIEQMAIPEGVREVVGRRLSRLDDDLQATLSTAAVVGHDVDLAVLAQVTGAEEDDLVDQLEQAVAAGLVQEQGIGRYRFAHALVRTTLLDELSTTKRVRQHRKVAQALEQVHADDLDAVAAELAHQWCEAAAGAAEGVVTTAISWCSRAAHLARWSGAADDAISWYQRALELAEDGEVDPEVRAAVLVGLAEARTGARDDGATEAVHEAARAGLDLGRIDLATRALLASGRTSFEREQEPDPEKLGLLAEVIPLVVDDATRARLLMTQSIEMIFVDDRTRWEVADQARALAGQTDDLDTVIFVASLSHTVRTYWGWTLPEIRAEAEHIEQLLDPAIQQSEPSTIAWIFVGAFYLALGARGAVDGLGHRRVLAKLTALDRLAGDPGVAMAVKDMLFVTALLEGRLADAGAILDEEQQLLEVGADQPRIAMHKVGLLRELGQLELALPGFETYLALNPESAAGQAGRAQSLVAAGRLDEAAEALTRAADAGFSSMPDDAALPIAIGGWCEVAHAVADTEAAGQLLEMDLDWSGMSLTGGIFNGSLQRLRGRLLTTIGHHEEADPLFAQAVIDHEALEATLWVCRTHLDWAEALVGQGRSAEAAEQLALADALLEGHDWPALQAQRARLGSPS